MKPVIGIACLLAGCGTGLLPNKPPQLTHVNGEALQRPLRTYGQVEGPQLIPGDTLTMAFEINEPTQPGFDVYWPEPLPGWSWDAETLTATWLVPEVIVDSDPFATMLILDRDRSDPKFTEVTIWFEPSGLEGGF